MPQLLPNSLPPHATGLWPEALRIAHELCMHSSLPMFLCWGETRQLYCNEACSAALGAPPSDAWQVLHEHLEAVFATAHSLTDVRCVVRDAHADERHFNCNLHPLLHKETIGLESTGVEHCVGVLVHACEITEQVIGLRRVQALQQLAERLLSVNSLTALWDTLATQTTPSMLFDGAICRRIDEEHGEVVLSSGPYASLSRGQRVERQSLARLLQQDGRSIQPIDLRNDATVHGWLLIPTMQADTEPMQVLVGLINQTIARIHAVDLVLQDATARRDLFIGRLAHELRNPLAALAAAAQLLRKAADHPAAAAPAREALTRQITAMTLLLNELQDASRAARGNLVLQRAPLLLHEALRMAVDAVQPQFERKRQQLEVELGAEGLRIDGDAARLRQVFVHLLLNANRFTPETGAIQLTVQSTQEEVLVRIRDTGCGITPQALPWLFDMYRPREAMPLLSGLGVGLPFAQGIVQSHGGELTACSAGLKLGSEFCVRLPLADRSLATSMPSTR